MLANMTAKRGDALRVPRTEETMLLLAGAREALAQEGLADLSVAAVIREALRRLARGGTASAVESAPVEIETVYEVGARDLIYEKDPV